MEFFAHNGYYEEEQKIGNRYSVDVEIDIDFTDASISGNLSKTVNYEIVYKVVQQEISKKSKLLESIVLKINKGLIAKFESIKRIKTTVCKHNPPFGGLCDKVCISDVLEK